MEEVKLKKNANEVPEICKHVCKLEYVVSILSRPDLVHYRLNLFSFLLYSYKSKDNPLKTKKSFEG